LFRPVTVVILQNSCCSIIVISTSVEKPLTEGVVPVSESNTKSEVLVVRVEGKVKLAE